MIPRWLFQARGVLLLWAVGCTASRPLPQSRVHVAPPAPAPTPQPSSQLLYPVDEALRDVLSGELEYVGTGRWPGIERSYACAFRNQRVLVVSAYCAPKETPAFRLDVYSPERGRVSIYAEARGGVSARNRASYFTFTAASAPAPTPDTLIPPVALAMSYDDLQHYERRRYAAFLPSCFGGERHAQREGACLGALAPHADAWAARNRDFLEHANSDWYHVVGKLRELANRYGRDPD